MGLRRGDIVTVAAPGDFGKPPPALVVQSDDFSEHPTVTLCLLTSALRDAPLFRLDVAPTSENGLRVPSQIQVDKLLASTADAANPTICEIA
ncbi:MAG: type II toxin-antitoxin system PemK/MazF family toxin [Gammaproteobacteria bacterium]|nr:type II toxin-antitoxin system PemK/MazF family toxin [Gammaproteobacteria bacterium]